LYLIPDGEDVHVSVVRHFGLVRRHESGHELAQDALARIGRGNGTEFGQGEALIGRVELEGLALQDAAAIPERSADLWPLSSLVSSRGLSVLDLDGMQNGRSVEDVLAPLIAVLVDSGTCVYEESLHDILME